MPDPWQWWSAEQIARATGCPQSAIESNWPLISGALDRRGLWERDVARGVLATIAIETASTFQPIHEYGTEADWAGYSGGARYAGRGFIQLTHDYNYRAAGQVVNVNLVADPDRALEPALAAEILAWYWATKTIPAKTGPKTWTLAQLCREHDWEWVRRAVQGGTNGLDRLLQIVNDLGEESTVAQLRVTEDGVRLRERPDTSSPVLASYPAGALMTPLTDHAWRQVRGTDGLTGWMAAEYLETSSNESPKVEDPPSNNIAGLHFDPSTPTYLQKADFTCSIGSVIWMLRSLSMAVEPEDAYDAMVPQYVTPALGLLDASGAGIVRVLADRWGVGAYNDASASFDDVTAVAGRMPVALGLRNWGQPGGHWSAVRGFDGERLVLANPAGTGPRYGQQTLTREQFDARGPASMVVVPIGG